MDDKLKNKKHNSQERLFDALQFDAADLKANQHGKLSAKQYPILKAEYQTSVGINYLIIVGMIIYNLVLVLLFVLHLEQANAICGWFFLGALIAFRFGLENYRHSLKLEQDLKKPRIARITGRAIIQASALWIGHHHWKLSREEISQFNHHDIYTLYYLPHTQSLLSVQWVSTSRDINN